VFDEEGNILEEKAMDANEVERRKKIATIRNKVEDLIQRAKSSNEGMDLLLSTVMNIETSFIQIVPSTVQAPQQEYETLLVVKFRNKLKFIHQLMFVRREGAKESREQKNCRSHARERILRL
jgi:hypothetical protein